MGDVVRNTQLGRAMLFMGRNPCTNARLVVRNSNALFAFVYVLRFFQHAGGAGKFEQLVQLLRARYIVHELADGVCNLHPRAHDDTRVSGQGARAGTQLSHSCTTARAQPQPEAATSIPMFSPLLAPAPYH